MSGINSLKLEHFKAFENSVDFQFAGKNVLVFGENGSGKTSVYDALKMAFFSDRLEAEEVKPSTTPEDAVELKRKMYDSYRHVKSADPFFISIDGTPYTAITRDDYRLFLITHDDFDLQGNQILLNNLLNKLFYDFGSNNVETFLTTMSDQLMEDVNRNLQECFSESVQIIIEKGDSFRCVLSDLDGNLVQGKNLNRYFNEGKIHLILLIIYLTTAILLKDTSKKNIIVLDDFITSLDAANRAYVIRFLFDMVAKDTAFQTMVFTHNVSFYNLFRHYINKYLNEVDRATWLEFNLYNFGDEHRFYPHDNDTLDKIKQDFDSGTDTLERLGNRIRQQFEMRVHEISKIIVSGGIEESGIILDRMFKGEPVYYFESKDVYKLVEELELLANSGETDAGILASNLKSTIDIYKNDSDLDNLRKELKNMALFQKVSLHPSSHGVIGLKPVSQKELTESIAIIKRLDDCIKGIKGKNLTNM